MLAQVSDGFAFADLVCSLLDRFAATSSARLVLEGQLLTTDLHDLQQSAFWLLILPCLSLCHFRLATLSVGADLFEGTLLGEQALYLGQVLYRCLGAPGLGQVLL